MADVSAPKHIGWRSRPTFVLAAVTAGLFTDLFLYTLVVPVTPFLLRDRLDIPTQELQSRTSGLLAAYSGASVLFSVPSGWAADTLGIRKPPLYCGVVFLAIGTTLFAVGQTFVVLFVARVFQGLAAAVIWSIGLAMVQDTVGPQRIGQAIGTIFSITALGELIAPALGGLLYEAAGMRAIFGLSVGLIGVDLIMLLVLVESKRLPSANRVLPRDEIAASESDDADAAENRPLLVKPDSRQQELDVGRNRILQVFPVLYCFGEPRFLMAMVLTTVQGTIIGLFDATVPLEAAALFHFSSRKAGLIFTALILPYIVLSPAAGMAVDRYGTKVLATCGYGYFAVSLATLGLPSQHLLSTVPNEALFSVILALNGCGLALISSPGFVEAIDMAGKYEAEHPGVFSDLGPYAQVLGFNSVFLFAGMTLGPLLSGALRELLGYGTMSLVFSGLALVTAILSYRYVGETSQAVDAE